VNYYYTLMNNTETLTTIKSRRLPKYVQLAEKLRRDILDGKFKIGECVPSQERLVNQHKVALTTVRQAVEVLQNEGLLKSVHGKGIFVQDASAYEKSAKAACEYKIGFLFAGSSLNSHFNHLVQLDIQKYTHNSGINIVFDTYFTGQQGEEQHITQWSEGLNGVILMGYIDDNLLNILRKNVKHFVVIGGTICSNEEGLSKITLDYKSAVLQAAGFFAGFGHKHIVGVVCTDTTLPVLCQEFDAGLKAASQEADVCTEMLGYTTGNMNELVNNIRNMPQQPTAMVSLGTEHSYRLMAQMVTSGLKVPEHISMIAIGDKRLTHGFTPKLTCISVQSEYVAQMTVEAVVRAVKSNICTFQEVPGVLSLGETCIPFKK